MPQIIASVFPDDSVRAQCIARYESTGGWGYRPTATNGSNTGLFEIDKRTWDWQERSGSGRAIVVSIVGRLDWSRMLDATYNTRAARLIYLYEKKRYGNGWLPWSTRGDCGA